MTAACERVNLRRAVSTNGGRRITAPPRLRDMKLAVQQLFPPSQVITRSKDIPSIPLFRNGGERVLKVKEKTR